MLLRQHQQLISQCALQSQRKNLFSGCFQTKRWQHFNFVFYRIPAHSSNLYRRVDIYGASQLQLFILGTLLYRLADTTCCWCSVYQELNVCVSVMFMCVSLILLISLISNSISPNRFPAPHIYTQPVQLLLFHPTNTLCLASGVSVCLCRTQSFYHSVPSDRIYCAFTSPISLYGRAVYLWVCQLSGGSLDAEAVYSSRVIVRCGRDAGMLGWYNAICWARWQWGEILSN